MVGENMEYLLGLLTPVVLFLCGYIGYSLGNKQKPKKPKHEDQQRKVEHMEKMHNDFVKMMNYNESIALQRKKVRHNE